MGTRKKMFLIVLTVVALTLSVVITVFAGTTVTWVKNLSGSASVPDWTNSSTIEAAWSLGGENTSTATDTTIYLYVVSKKNNATDWDKVATQYLLIPKNSVLSQSGSGLPLRTDGNNNDIVKISYYVTTTSGLTTTDLKDLKLDVKDQTHVDTVNPGGYIAMPPLVSGKAACNEFERFGVVTDTPSGVDVFAFRVGTADQASTTPGGKTRVFFASDFMLPGYSTTLDFGGRVIDVATNESKKDGAWSFSTSGIGPCKSFTDVSGHPYEKYIRYLGSAGIFAGYTDGSFKPDGTINRAEFATILVKAAGVSASSLPTKAPKASCDFSDVSSSDWFAGWVWKACDMGFVAGYGDGTFRPANPVLRAEAVTMLYNARNTSSGFFNGSVIGSANGDLLGNPSYTDVPAWTYYATPVQYLYNAGIVDEASGTSFRPGDYATRGEVAKWLYRSLGEYTALP